MRCYQSLLNDYWNKKEVHKLEMLSHEDTLRLYKEIVKKLVIKGLVIYFMITLVACTLIGIVMTMTSRFNIYFGALICFGYVSGSVSLIRPIFFKYKRMKRHTNTNYFLGKGMIKTEKPLEILYMDQKGVEGLFMAEYKFFRKCHKGDYVLVIYVPLEADFYIYYKIKNRYVF